MHLPQWIKFRILCCRWVYKSIRRFWGLGKLYLSNLLLRLEIVAGMGWYTLPLCQQCTVGVNNQCIDCFLRNSMVTLFIFCSITVLFSSFFITVVMVFNRVKYSGWEDSAWVLLWGQGQSTSAYADRAKYRVKAAVRQWEHTVLSIMYKSSSDSTHNVWMTTA